MQTEVLLLTLKNIKTTIIKTRYVCAYIYKNHKCQSEKKKQ